MFRKLKSGLGEMDTGFLAIVLMLTAYGLIMVYSASSPNAFYVKNDSTYFFRNQLIWAVLGIITLFITSLIDYRFIKKMRMVIYSVAVGLLAIVAVAGATVNGAKRWIRIGAFSMQPSEFAKIAIVIMCAYVLSKLTDTRWKNTLPYVFSCILIFSLVGIFLLFQPHFSAMIIIVGSIAIMMLVAGIPLRIFTAVGIPVVLLGVVVVAIEPYRLERVLSFMDPFKYKQDEGWQVVQSLYAIGSGGGTGLGLGRSRQKYLYIPEPQNDFIFSIICEELGFIGALLVIGLFVALLLKGVKIALNAPDKYSMILTFGLLSIVAVQALLNIAVATSSVPATGIPLPFFSAGGSSFVFQMMSMGMILNISRQPKVIIE